ncbi:HAD-IA family hydrolase [Patescibacteria group bacterium]|nr:HAD-IA family hydrolase [Patescibacteria group bacterium]
MNDSKKIILFDIGGVLIEYGDVFQTVAREQNFAHELIDSTFDKYDREITTGKITPQELYLKCLSENNLEADKEYNFVTSWISDYETIRPTYDLVQELMEIYEVGFLSNIYKGMVEEMISQKVLPHIEEKYRFLSCDIGMQKPDVELYDFVDEKLNLNKGELLFVDDKNENFPPALERGWEVFEFPRKNPEEGARKLKELLL